jgi:hypothetical protein
MRIKRRLPVLFGFLLFVAAVALVVFLRKHAPPEPARLLPGADGFVYLDLKWMRYTDIAGKIPQVHHDPEYEQFIQATGFEFERDLKEAAVAIHYPSPANGPETRFSYVFSAKLDGDRFRTYLKQLAASTEEYRSVTIYNIPLEGRTLRVAILGVDTVAISNHNDPVVIRGIIERSRKLASPFGGPALLRQFYKHVPLSNPLTGMTLAWAIFRVPARDATGGGPMNHALFPLAGQAGTSVVGSISASPFPSVQQMDFLAVRNIHFRAEAFTPDEQAAQQLTEQADAYLGLFRSAEISVGAKASDPDIQKSIESLKIEQKKDRAVLTATVPVELIRKLVAQAPGEIGPQPRQ